MKTGYHIGLKMTKTQKILGWLYLPVYLVLLSMGLAALEDFLGLNLSNLERNVCYFAINFVFVLSVYGKFLLKSIRGFSEDFWKFVQTLILGFVLYYFTAFVLAWAMNTFFSVPANPNDAAVRDLLGESRVLMLVVSVVIAPIVEETLLRGVVFGTFHPKARIFGYVASALVFSVMHVWQFFPDTSVLNLCLSALQYIPASVALCWTYEKAGTLWAPIVLHGFINAISVGVTVFS